MKSTNHNCGCNSSKVKSQNEQSSQARSEHTIKVSQSTIEETEYSGNLCIPAGTTTVFDAHNGPLRIDGQLINHGTLRIIGDATEVEIQTSGIINDGEIVSEVDNLRFINNQNEPFVAELEEGKISAPKQVEFCSEREISLKGGDLISERAAFLSKKFLLIFANEINAKIALAGTKSALSVNRGDLIIERNDVTDDPTYYNFSGNISAPGFTYSGELVQDYVAAASGNVEITGAISTTGNVLLMAGANFHFLGTLPTSGSGQLTDADCILHANTTCSYATAFDSFGSTASLTTQSIDAEGYITLIASGEIEVDGDLDSPDYIWTYSLGDQRIEGNIESENAGVGLSTLDGDGSIEVDGDISAVVVEIWGGTEDSPSSSTTVSVTGTIRAWEHIDIYAGGDVGVGDVISGATGYPGRITIRANLSGNSSEFVIGAQSGTNHALSLIASTDTAGSDDLVTSGSDPNVWRQQVGNQWIAVSNSGDGGISIENGSAIFMSATDSPNGAILIDANGGELKLKGGTLSASGTGTNKAGQIALRGQQVTLTNGATIEANDYGSDGSNHYVLIATRLFSYSGGATINSNGDAGPDIKSGVIFNTDSGTEISLIVFPQVEQFDDNDTSLQIWSPDGSTLNVYTYGEGAGSYIAANPVTFYVGQAHFIAYGEDTKQTIHFPGTASGLTSLAFDYGYVAFYADGNNADGGTIKINADKIAGSANGSLGLYARGFGSTGEGGTILVDAEAIDFGDSSVWIYADGSSTSGNGGNISLESDGKLDLSYTVLSADSGSSGNGGTIDLVYAGSSQEPLKIHTISATGSSTNGGDVSITNTQEADLDVVIYGNLDTHAGTSLAGSTSLYPTGATSNASILVSTGGFNSIVSVTCNIFQFSSNVVVELGLDQVEASDNINIIANLEDSFITVPNEESSVTAVNAIDIDTPTFINSGDISSKVVRIGLNNVDAPEFKITNGGSITGTNGGSDDIIIGGVKDVIMDGNGSFNLSNTMGIVSEGNITVDSALKVNGGANSTLYFQTEAELLQPVGGLTTLNYDVTFNSSGDSVIEFDTATLVNNAIVTNTSTGDSGIFVHTTHSAIQEVVVSGTGSMVGMTINFSGNAGMDAYQASLTQPSSGNPATLVGALIYPNVGSWICQIGNGDVSIGNISTVNGYIIVQASDDVTVLSGTTLSANTLSASRDITLLSDSGSFVIESSATLETPSGSIFVSNSPKPTPPYTAGTAPGAYISYGGGSPGSVYWGSGVTANSPTNTLDAQNGQAIVFNGTVTLSGGVTMNAGH